MNLQQRFQQENYERRYIESDCGYICYNAYPDASIYIHELYVLPEKRALGEGRKLEGQLIQKEKPAVIYCDVDLTSKNPEISLKAILAGGYIIEECLSSKIILKRTIHRGR